MWQPSLRLCRSKFEPWLVQKRRGYKSKINKRHRERTMTHPLAYQVKPISKTNIQFFSKYHLIFARGKESYKLCPSAFDLTPCTKMSPTHDRMLSPYCTALPAANIPVCSYYERKCLQPQACSYTQYVGIVYFVHRVFLGH